jgi:hypothetical protein
MLYQQQSKPESTSILSPMLLLLPLTAVVSAQHHWVVGAIELLEVVVNVPRHTAAHNTQPRHMMTTRSC